MTFYLKPKIDIGNQIQTFDKEIKYTLGDILFTFFPTLSFECFFSLFRISIIIIIYKMKHKTDETNRNIPKMKNEKIQPSDLSFRM